MDVCLLCVLCVVRLRSLRRADHSSRGDLPTVARRYVIKKSRGRGGHRPRWAADSEKILIIILATIYGPYKPGFVSKWRNNSPSQKRFR
jgi:hypothetical protein